MKITKLIPLLLTTVIIFGCTRESNESLIYQRLNQCNSSELDSTILCGKLSVFENRETNTGRKIDLNIIVIPAIQKNESKPPIFYFEGGPGLAATNAAPFYADSANPYRLQHDIVLIDVRGTGDSNPLHCRQLQYKEGLEQQLSEMYPTQNVMDCYDSLSQFADLTQYTTTNMAIDIDEVRKWLGYDKITLFGLSYGGRLAQVYMKMFPNSVESCVLWSPTKTSSRMPLYHAQYAEASIKKIFEDCKEDSLCNKTFQNIENEFRELIKRGNQEPFKFEIKSQSGENKTIAIPLHSFNSKIRSLMYSPYGIRQIPFIIHQSYLGNWQPFISLFPADSSFDSFLAEGLYLCVTCTEDVPYITNQEADSLTAGTFMGDYRIQQQLNACKYWTKGSIPKDFFDPVESNIPTLVLSGYFDPVTPPSMAEQIVITLPNSFLIPIRTMSHRFEGLSNPECFNKMVIDFFNNPYKEPNSDCSNEMQPVAYKLKG